MKPTPPDLIDVHAVAELLGISPRTVWRWVERGRLPSPARLSPVVLRWDRTNLVRWLADRAGSSSNTNNPAA